MFLFLLSSIYQKILDDFVVLCCSVFCLWSRNQEGIGKIWSNCRQNWLTKICLQSTIKHKIFLHFRFRPLPMKKIIQYDSFQSFNLKKAFFAFIRSLFDFVLLFFFQMGGTEIVKSCWSNFEIGCKKQEKKVKYKTEVSRLSELQRIKTRSLNAGQHWSAGLGRKV